MCDYKPGILENSAKMVLLFHLIEESVRKGDKILVFRWTINIKHIFFFRIEIIGCGIPKPFSAVLSLSSFSASSWPFRMWSYVFYCSSSSQSLTTLTVIEDFLAKRPVPPSPYPTNKDRPNQNWVRNLNYYSKSSLIMVSTSFKDLLTIQNTPKEEQISFNLYFIWYKIVMTEYGLLNVL